MTLSVKCIFSDFPMMIQVKHIFLLTFYIFMNLNDLYNVKKYTAFLERTCISFITFDFVYATHRHTYTTRAKTTKPEKIY